MQEKQAIAQLKRGEISGLSVLVKQYQVKAIRVACLITRDKAMAEDIVQNAFIKVYQRIDQFDAQRPFEPWFLRSVVNASLQAVKIQQRTVSLEPYPQDEFDFAEFLISSEPALEEYVLHGELRTLIKQALDHLPAEQRAVVVMRYFLEMSEKEIARVLESPQGTIKWRLSSAKQKLKGILRRQALSTEKEVDYE
jgi:RNA polymerase sigma-70 factor, ECF subfamily